jgi:hypothetical protein
MKARATRKTTNMMAPLAAKADLQAAAVLLERAPHRLPDWAGLSHGSGSEPVSGVRAPAAESDRSFWIVVMEIKTIVKVDQHHRHGRHQRPHHEVALVGGRSPAGAGGGGGFHRREPWRWTGR